MFSLTFSVSLHLKVSIIIRLISYTYIIRILEISVINSKFSKLNRNKIGSDFGFAKSFPYSEIFRSELADFEIPSLIFIPHCILIFVQRRE